VVYEMDPEQKPNLDAVEGLGYEPSPVTIRCLNTRKRISAFTYIANDIRSDLLPFDWYKYHVMVGACEQGLPLAYRQMLAKSPALFDTDLSRRQQELSIYLTVS